ncbi:MAG: LptF/LptG family permease [Campylobacteraceae bacterium]|jgi:lipopolysaccharide export system permease protein|nr:LptF/LptG family permease [Campylobacteraceae bacterium]
MIKIYQRYIIFLYFKNFFIIFCALEFFYAGVDFITNYKDLPSSANLQLLYVSFNFMSAVSYTLPLSIVFAMIISKFSMIRSNELLCMYSVGITKNAMILPIFLSAFFLVFVYMFLNFTSFAYAYEYRSNLLKYSQIMRSSSNLFLKYEGKYVYFGELNPLTQEALDIKIFDIEDNELKEIITAKKGVFEDNTWILESAERIKKPKIEARENASIEIEMFDSIRVLEQFRPKIIENAHLGSQSLSIPDAIDAIKFFGAQGINMNSVKTNLYFLIFFPFFAPFAVVILYYYLPISGRFFNLALMNFGFIFVTLVAWGVLFMLSRFALNSIILPEVAILIPIMALGVFAFILYRKNR